MIPPNTHLETTGGLTTKCRRFTTNQTQPTVGRRPLSLFSPPFTLDRTLCTCSPRRMPSLSCHELSDVLTLVVLPFLPCDRREPAVPGHTLLVAYSGSASCSPRQQ